MAKKHTSKKKSDNLLLWGIGVAILIVIVIILAKGCTKEVPVEEETPVVAEQPEVVAEEPVQILGLEEINCDISAAIGYRSCAMLESGDIEFVIMHQGAGTLIGFQYYLYDDNGELIGEDADMMAVEGNSEATLTLPASKFSGVSKIEVRPVMTVNGVDGICKNQHVIQYADRC